MIVAHWPPFSPHHLEYVEVKALAPTNAKPIIMRNIAFPIPAMPRYTTDIYATAEANRRYIAVYIAVFISKTILQEIFSRAYSSLHNFVVNPT